MQSHFDKFQTEIRQAKNASGCTIQELADGSGVPLDFASSITSGSAKRPSLYYSAAVCAYFGLSMDELLGVPVDHAQNANIDEAVRAENERLKADNHKLETESACMKNDVEHFKRLSTIYRLLIFGLIGICAILLCAVVGYIIFDIQFKNIGLFKSGSLTVLAIVLALVVVAAITLIAIAIKTVVHDAKITKRSQDEP